MHFPFPRKALPSVLLVVLIATTGLTFVNPAQAQLLLDLTAAGQTPGAAQSTDKVIPGAAAADGFSPLVFAPGRTTASLEIQGGPDTRRSWSGAISLKAHLHNPMPWPLTLDVTLSDNGHGRLTTRLAVPPGPAMTLVIPLRATRAIAWGMRASPPALIETAHDRALVATRVDGGISSSDLQTLELSIPAPDSEQTVRLGKVFYESRRDDERRLYETIVDCHGQFTRQDWPGKRHGDCDRTASAPDESRSTKAAAGQAALPVADPTDAYGGMLIPGWPDNELATGYFRTYRTSELSADRPGRWLLLTPAGNPFFSLGVNAVQMSNSATVVEGREFMFSDLPAPDAPDAQFYGQLTAELSSDAGAQRGRGFKQGRTFDFYRANLRRTLGSDYAGIWLERTRERLQQWQFNSIGAWTDETFIAQSGLPFTLIVHIDGQFARLSDGLDWWGGISDPFDPAFAKALDHELSQTAARYRHNPALIGYFVDNELGWGDGSASVANVRWAVALSALATDAGAPDAHAKRAFVKWLRSRYASPEALGRAWKIPLTSWQQLQAPLASAGLQPGLSLTLKEDLTALSGLLAEQYYSLVRQTLKRYDPDHLYLGSRFAARTPEAVHACQLHCDVVSFNLYVPDIRLGFEAASFARYDKPAMLTEFHFGSSDSGPFWPGVMAVPSEADRGPAYERMLQSVIDNRQFIGAHWFQYLDQPVTGRWLDGENGHLGLVDITDSPWETFTGEVARINRAMMSQLRSRLRTRTH